MNCDSGAGPNPPEIARRESLREFEPAVIINIPAPSEIESRLQPSFHDSGLGSSRPSGASLVPPLSLAAPSVSSSRCLQMQQVGRLCHRCRRTMRRELGSAAPCAPGLRSRLSTIVNGGNLLHIPGPFGRH